MEEVETYLATLPRTVLDGLYADPSTCQAVFRYVRHITHLHFTSLAVSPPGCFPHSPSVGFCGWPLACPASAGLAFCSSGPPQHLGARANSPCAGLSAFVSSLNSTSCQRWQTQKMASWLQRKKADMCMSPDVVPSAGTAVLECHHISFPAHML